MVISRGGIVAAESAAGGAAGCGYWSAAGMRWTRRLRRTDDGRVEPMMNGDRRGFVRDRVRREGEQIVWLKRAMGAERIEIEYLQKQGNSQHAAAGRECDHVPAGGRLAEAGGQIWKEKAGEDLRRRFERAEGFPVPEWTAGIVRPNGLSAQR